MKKPTNVTALTDLGRVRLSKSFFMAKLAILVPPMKPTTPSIFGIGVTPLDLWVQPPASSYRAIGTPII